jgi:AhpD family alkylhydroperoxidase
MSIQDHAFRRQVRHIRPIARDPRISAVHQQIIRDVGVLLPPFAIHLPVPDALAAYWAIFREPTYGPRVDRPKKEAVAVAVSATNICPYCVDVHTTALQAVGDRTSAAAIDSGETGAITDPELRGVVAWARANRQPDAPILSHRPFPDEDAPELIGVALAYHYINRMVNIFVARSPFPTRGRRLAKRLAPRVFRRLLTREVRPGAALDLLPPNRLPDDLDWAQSDPIVAEAFGRAAAAYDAVGRRALPEQVRQLVAARLDSWHGEDLGISRAWVESDIAPLAGPQRPLARLALLAALASHQVDPQVLADARTHTGSAGDELLVATASWASFAAARRIGTWLNTAPLPRPAVPARAEIATTPVARTAIPSQSKIGGRDEHRISW